jgi:hypothetical protein
MDWIINNLTKQRQNAHKKNKTQYFTHTVS